MEFYLPPSAELGSLAVQLEAIAQMFISRLDKLGFDE